MVHYFVEEILQCNAKSSVSELGENLDTLISLILVYGEKIEIVVNQFRGEVDTIKTMDGHNDERY